MVCQPAQPSFWRSVSTIVCGFWSLCRSIRQGPFRRHCSMRLTHYASLVYPTWSFSLGLSVVIELMAGATVDIAFLPLLLLSFPLLLLKTLFCVVPRSSSLLVACHPPRGNSRRRRHQHQHQRCRPEQRRLNHIHDTQVHENPLVPASFWAKFFVERKTTAIQ